MKKIVYILSLFSLLFALSCGNENKKPANANTPAKPDVKTGVAAVADNEVAIIEMDNPAYGKMKLELYSNIAPQMVARFKELAKEGFYNGTTFHRVSGIVIQGGDPKGDGTGGSGKPNVPSEMLEFPFEPSQHRAFHRPG